MREPFIALDYDGAENGRKSDIRLLIIASSKKIFLFDILTLGSAAFDSGLRKILESPNVKKIVHDCKNIGDSLQHKYSVTLNNVFDTQAVAFLVEKEMTGQEAKFTKSLAQTLKDVLHMPKDLIFERLVRLGYVEEDNARWHKRPLDADLECQIIKNVPYLFLLHEKLLSVYMEKLNNAISINLEVREANETERKEIERRIWETLSPLLPSPSLPLPSVDPSIWFVPELDQEYKTWEPVCHRTALLCKISSKEELRIQIFSATNTGGHNGSGVGLTAASQKKPHQN
uniref:3'-5' exonuclease domain-containing protein n=1 Tax=Timema tahoe TaxID=61484 RepID=A0A7R9FIH6_9NEOP|nr:unnamed protein product [Timema tahoe]